MSLALVNFGSLPEATIALSALASAGLNPVAGFNMNTPGISGGMSPNAYPVLVPDEELQAARLILSDIRKAFAEEADEPEMSETLDEGHVQRGRTTLGRLRPIARWLAGVAVVACILILGWEMFGR